MVQRRRKKVVWTLKAIDSRKSIFEYWNHRNRSKTYSEKLNKLFLQAIKIIVGFPESSIRTQSEKFLLKVVRDYQIIYQITDDEIVIHYIWDTRQNPLDFPIK